MKTQEMIADLMSRLNELRHEKETLMDKMQHFRINYAGWMDSEDGKKAKAEYKRLTNLDQHYSMVILDLKALTI